MHEDFAAKLLEALGFIDCVVFPFSGEAPTMTPVVWTWSRPQAQVDPRKVIRIAQRPIYRANILSGGILKHHQQSFGLRPSVMVLLPAPRASVDKDKMALWKHQHAHLLTTLKEALVSKSLARVPGSKVSKYHFSDAKLPILSTPCNASVLHNH